MLDYGARRGKASLEGNLHDEIFQKEMKRSLHLLEKNFIQSWHRRSRPGGLKKSLALMQRHQDQNLEEEWPIFS